jgi:hypothetical protein
VVKSCRCAGLPQTWLLVVVRAWQGGRCAAPQGRRLRGLEAQIEPCLAPSPDLVVGLTSTLVAGGRWCRGALGEIGRRRGVQVQRGCKLAVSRAVEAQQQYSRCKGASRFSGAKLSWMAARNEQPHHVPARRHLTRAPDLSPKHQSLADRAHRPEPRCRTALVDAPYRHARHDTQSELSDFLQSLVPAKCSFSL